VFAGVDYAAILAAAEKEAEVIVWDGGNNDTPFFTPDVQITGLRSPAARPRAPLFPRARPTCCLPTSLW
jgi:predicted GTPase